MWVSYNSILHRTHKKPEVSSEADWHADFLSPCSIEDRPIIFERCLQQPLKLQRKQSSRGKFPLGRDGFPLHSNGGPQCRVYRAGLSLSHSPNAHCKHRLRQARATTWVTSVFPECRSIQLLQDTPQTAQHSEQQSADMKGLHPTEIAWWVQVVSDVSSLVTYSIRIFPSFQWNAVETKLKYVTCWHLKSLELHQLIRRMVDPHVTRNTPS